jgi:DNA polymerase-4
VNPRQIRRFLSGPVNRIPGIGKKVEERLGHLEVRTIDELARLNPIILHETFGKSLGTYLSRAARGEDDEPVRNRLLPTQLSRIGTLKVNTRDFHIIRPILMNLTESVTEKLNEKDMSCKSVSIIASLSDLTIHTKSTTLESATTDSPLILEASERLMRQFLDSMPQAVLRRVGVKLSGLSKLSGQTTIRSFVST